MQVSEQAKKDHLISSYVRALEKKAKEEVMSFATIATGTFFIVFGVSLLGVAVPGVVLGIWALVAGGLVLAGR